MIRRATSLIAALAVVALGAVAWPAAAEPPAPVGPAESAFSVELDAYGPAVLDPGGSLQASIVITSRADAAVGGLSAALAITTAPIASRDALSSFIDDPSSAATRVVADAPVGQVIPADQPATTGSLGPGATALLTLAAPGEALGLPEKTWGVYGVTVTLSGADGVLYRRSMAVTWMDAVIPTLPVAVVATAAGSPERIAQVAAAANVPSVALALDPTAVSGPGAASAIAGSRELYVLPGGHPDLTSLAHADGASLLEFAVDDSRRRAPESLQGLPWLAITPVADAPTLHSAALRGARAALLDVVGGAVAPKARAADGPPRPVIDVTANALSIPLLVPDSRLSTLLATYQPGTPDAAARLVADAALAAADGDGVTPIVISPGANWELPEVGASAKLTALLAAPWITRVTLESVIAGDSRGSASAGDDADTTGDLPAEHITSLTRRLARLDQLAVTVDSPDDILVPGARELLIPVGLALRGRPDVREAAYTTAVIDVDTTLSAVTVNPGSDLNLIAASGKVPVKLHNDLAADATVTVIMRSASPNLRVKDQPEVVIPAGGDVTAQVSVEAVSSANVTVTVSIENARGDVVASPQLLHIRVRADWGNAVTAAFSVALAGLLVAGLIRTIRRGRKTTRLAPSDAEVARTGTERGSESGSGGDDD